MQSSRLAPDVKKCADCSSFDGEASAFCPRCGARRPLFAIGDGVAGRFRVVEILALGPSREVYSVAHSNRDGWSVLKVLPVGIAVAPGARERLRAEARLASRVRHRNVASVEEAGTLPDGSEFILREHVAGEPLDVLLEREGLAPDRAVDIAMGVLEGLAALHAAAIVHGDVSPDNVIVMPGAGNGLKLIDLGIAEETAACATRPPAREGFRGKPRYASPEQRAALSGAAANVDERSDVFSAGALLAEMLGAEPPSAAGLPDTVSPDLAAVVRRSLEEDPAARFAGAAEFREALRQARPSEGAAMPGRQSPRPRRLPTVVTVEEDLPADTRRASRAGMTYAALSAACVLLALLSLALVRVMADRRRSADAAAGPLAPFAPPPSRAQPDSEPSPVPSGTPRTIAAQDSHPKPGPVPPPPAANGRSRSLPPASTGSLPAAMDETEAAKRLDAALRAWDYYQVSPECLRARAAGYREAGYTFDVVSKGCGFFRSGETLGRWRIDGRTGEALVQNARGRFVRPG